MENSLFEHGCLARGEWPAKSQPVRDWPDFNVQAWSEAELRAQNQHFCPGFIGFGSAR